MATPPTSPPGGWYGNNSSSNRKEGLVHRELCKANGVKGFLPAGSVRVALLRPPPAFGITLLPTCDHSMRRRSQVSLISYASMYALCCCCTLLLGYLYWGGLGPARTVLLGFLALQVATHRQRPSVPYCTPILGCPCPDQSFPPRL